MSTEFYSKGICSYTCDSLITGLGTQLKLIYWLIFFSSFFSYFFYDNNKRKSAEFLSIPAPPYQKIGKQASLLKNEPYEVWLIQCISQTIVYSKS